MSELIYIDTNVWLDLILNRKDRIRPIGDFAFELFRSTLSCHYTILISDWVVRECNNQGVMEEFENLLNTLKKAHKIKLIESDYQQRKNAKSHEHWQDYLHVLLAQKGEVSFFVTRNIRDFADDWYSFEVVLPEELIR